MMATFDPLFRLAVLHRLRSTTANNDAETKKDDSESLEICCPLPFYLQDLCLLVVINELDCYPTELLAALPYWLRYRILNNVPALDLARLEHTPVASGVNTDEIWKSRVKADDPRAAQYKYTSSGWLRDVDPETEPPNKDSPFQLNISKDRNLYSHHGNYHGRNSLIQDVIKDLSDGKDLEVSIGNHHLLEIVSDLLTTSYNTDLEKATRRLVSIPSNLVLSNLLVGSVHHDCRNPHCNQEVWKKQVITLVVKDFNTRSYPYLSHHRPLSDIHLIPHRLLHFCDKPDPVELLSLLSKDCQLHPRGVNMHIDAISRSFLPSLHTERLALDDGGLSLPTEDAKYTSIVNSFLENVVSLRLRCDKYGQIGLLVSMIQAAVGAGRLKHLICALPDLYMDVVDPLCDLFLQPTFQLLSLELSDAYPLMLSKLLRMFITAPCPHAHKLLIDIKGGSQFQASLKENQVAAMNMQGLTIPPCSLQHKVLKLSSSDDLTKVLYLLLQYPTIRLKSLTLFTNNAYFHLCSIHPDLQVTKLAISVVGSQYIRRRSQQPQQIATIQQDIVSLFKITSLEKICIEGYWGPITEVKLGLAVGLRGRSRLPPLRKLSLELGSQTSYKVREFAMLCDALFSLPQLENLKLVLGKGYSDMLRNQRYEDVMYKSWSNKGHGVKLKLISLQVDIEKDFKKVKLLTEALSFSSPKHSSHYHREYYDYSDDEDYLYSEYFGYDPWQYFDYDSDYY